jgi:hypothetical protein
MTLSSQGVSEPDIIRTLKNEGYTPTQVDSAMREAMRGTVSSAPGPQTSPAPGPPRELPGEHIPEPIQEPLPPGPPPPSSREYSELAMPDLRDEAAPPSPGSTEGPPPPGEIPKPGLPRPGQPQYTEMPTLHPRKDLPPDDFAGDSLPEIPSGGQPEQGLPRLREHHTREEVKDDRRRALEELTEAIVDEKMIKIQEDLVNMRKSYTDLNAKLSLLEQNINQVKGEKTSGLEKVEGKIDTYKTSIGELSGKMEAIEKAVKDTLTPMMQSMRSLSDTIRDMKDEEKG